MGLSGQNAMRAYFSQIDQSNLTPVSQASYHQSTRVVPLNANLRAYHRVLRAARTIADLANSECIEPVHLAEATQYQPHDRTR